MFEWFHIEGFESVRSSVYEFFGPCFTKEGARGQALKEAGQERINFLFRVREYFSSQLKDVLGRDAILSVSPNNTGSRSANLRHSPDLPATSLRLAV